MSPSDRTYERSRIPEVGDILLTPQGRRIPKVEWRCHRDLPRVGSEASEASEANPPWGVAALEAPWNRLGGRDGTGVHRLYCTGIYIRNVI